jgi:hypothetical protein
LKPVQHQPPRALATVPAPKDKLPPRPLLERAIVRVKFAEFAPKTTGSTQHARELCRSDTKLETHPLGVVIHGTTLVPWSALYWVEYEAE